ncbi:MAG TPA: ribonuclease PH, partial [Solirubrobacteraceae bacterium]|nr:ribonuclease PH [Solirubrobacteraceae bacterium]
QADGGTRCASITGAYVALALACERLRANGLLERSPLTGSVAAVSCGIIGGAALLDLDYSEDSTAEVDANVVMTGEGGLVEVQATAERTPLSRAHLDELLALAAQGIAELRVAQERAVASVADGASGDGDATADAEPAGS